MAVRNGNEYSTERAIEAQEVDTVLVCSADRNGLERIRCWIKQQPAIKFILIGENTAELAGGAQVVFQSGFDEGDWVRLDNVSLPIRLPGSPALTPRSILEQIARQVA